MTDPFTVLRAPVTPADPDPEFAARLRDRLARALDLPEGVAVTDISTLPSPERAAPPALAARPAGAAAGQGRQRWRQGDIGYASLWVPDVARAAAFYGPVLGVEYQQAHGGRGWQAAGVIPPQGFWETADEPTLFCSYVVDDVTAAVARVRAAGGQASEPVRRPYGLTAECTDTEGARFALYQPLARAAGSPRGPAWSASGALGSQSEPAGSASTPAARDGDLIYVTLEVTDAGRTLAFYHAVLGWRSRPGRAPGGWQVEGTSPMIGLSGGHHRPTAVPVWHVADVAAAVTRARAAGGTATEPHREPYGLIAECQDDQGARFSLSQFPG